MATDTFGGHPGGALASSRTDEGTSVGRPTRTARWAGRVLSGVGILFLLFDAMGKVLRLAPAVEGTVALGYPESVLRPLGIVQLACAALYLYPRTAVLGVILWTGYLGGAVATHVRVGDPIFSHVLFPIYVASLLWLGLWLREPRLHAFVPLCAARRATDGARGEG
jgi:hypothetical protein